MQRYRERVPGAYQQAAAVLGDDGLFDPWGVYKRMNARLSQGPMEKFRQEELILGINACGSRTEAERDDATFAQRTNDNGGMASSVSMWSVGRH
ncbi:MAG: hypothetical protein QF886_26550 [Planctomycetota bacterium]|nr:hypothetical protein [Planctomycetota bacterium]